MSTDPPIIVTHPLDSDIRLIQIGPGYDPADEPLLAHAGVACEVHGPIWVAMTGLTGVSDKTRQFLTTANNDLDEEVLNILAKELSDPIRRFPTEEIRRQRLEQIKTDLDELPVIPDDLLYPTALDDLEAPEPDDTPEP